MEALKWSKWIIFVKKSQNFFSFGLHLIVFFLSIIFYHEFVISIKIEFWVYPLSSGQIPFFLTVLYVENEMVLLNRNFSKLDKVFFRRILKILKFGGKHRTHKRGTKMSYLWLSKLIYSFYYVEKWCAAKFNSHACNLNYIFKWMSKLQWTLYYVTLVPKNIIAKKELTHSTAISFYLLHKTYIDSVSKTTNANFDLQRKKTYNHTDWRCWLLFLMYNTINIMLRLPEYDWNSNQSINRISD